MAKKDGRSSFRVGYMLSVKLPRTNAKTDQTELTWVKIDMFPTIWKAQEYAAKEYPKFKSNIAGARASLYTPDTGSLTENGRIS